MRKSIAVFAVGSSLLGLLVTGCGGSEQIDKETYIEQANQICEEVSGKLAADVVSIGKRESAKPNSSFQNSQIATIEKGFVPRFEEELRKIRALEIPDEDKEEIEAFLEVYQQGVAKFKAKAKLVALSEKVAPHEVIAVAGTRLGITECPISPVDLN